MKKTTTSPAIAAWNERMKGNTHQQDIFIQEIFSGKRFDMSPIWSLLELEQVTGNIDEGWYKTEQFQFLRTMNAHEWGIITHEDVAAILSEILPYNIEVGKHHNM